MRKEDRSERDELEMAFLSNNFEHQLQQTYMYV